MCRKPAHLCFRIEADPEIFTINSKSACSVFFTVRLLGQLSAQKKAASLLPLKENIFTLSLNLY